MILALIKGEKSDKTAFACFVSDVRWSLRLDLKSLIGHCKFFKQKKVTFAVTFSNLNFKTFIF